LRPVFESTGQSTKKRGVQSSIQILAGCGRRFPSRSPVVLLASQSVGSPLRTVGDRRKACPHGADARDYAAVSRVFKVPVACILFFHPLFGLLASALDSLGTISAGEMSRSLIPPNRPSL